MPVLSHPRDTLVYIGSRVPGLANATQCSQCGGGGDVPHVAGGVAEAQRGKRPVHSHTAAAEQGQD